MTKLRQAPGLVYPPPADDVCDERHDDLTVITCERPKGHQGDHEGYAVVTWPREDP